MFYSVFFNLYLPISTTPAADSEPKSISFEEPKQNDNLASLWITLGQPNIRPLSITVKSGKQ